jgi:CBS domain-containing protein
MLAKDIMKIKVIKVSLDAPIAEVADLLHQNNITGIPVVNDENIVQGVVTERELFSADFKMHFPSYINLLKKTDFVLGGGKTMPYEMERIMHITAKEVMNKKVVFAEEDMDLSKLAARMVTQEAGIAPVVDSKSRLLGVISKGDLLRVFSNTQGRPKILNNPKYIENEFDYVEEDITSRFALVAKARANIWLTAGTILFIMGFVAGIVYVVNPNIFGK